MSTRQIGIDIRSAIKLGDTAKAISLIGTDKSIREMMTPFGTWLHVAATFGNLELVKYLVRAGADVNRRGGTYGGNALQMAADYGHLEVLQFLLTSGAELDVSEPERNPLFSAIQTRHNDVVRFLLDIGIDPEIRYSGENMNDMDALAFAQEQGNLEAVAILTARSKSSR